MNMIYLFFAHYVLDYPLQGEFLAKTKGTNIYSMLAHCMIYSLGMSICFNFLGVFSFWKFIVLTFTHALIDQVKASAKDKDKALTTYLYIDQFLHMLINIILVIA